MPVWQRFTDGARRVVGAAREEANRWGANEVEPEHLLLALLCAEDSDAVKIIEKCGLSPQQMQQDLIQWLKAQPPPRHPSPRGDRSLSEAAKRALQGAYNEARTLGHNYVGTEHLLLGLLTVSVSQALHALKAQLQQVRQEVRQTISWAGEVPPPDLELRATVQNGTLRFMSDQATVLLPALPPLLQEYGTDLSAQGMQLAPLIGREAVIEQLEMILLRRRRRGVCLVGPPGVGKMAVVAELQRRITARLAPEPLWSARVVTLNAGRLASASWTLERKDEILGRLLREVQQRPNFILAIEDLCLLFGAETVAWTRQVAGTLLLSLVQQDLPCLGTCSLADYHQLAAQLPRFAEGFRRLAVPEPTPADTVQILKAVWPRQQAHHGVTLDEEMFVRIVELAEANLPQGVWPRKAIDLLDAAAARARQQAAASPEWAELRRRLEDMEQTLDKHAAQPGLEKTAALREEAQRLREELERARAEWRKIRWPTLTEADLPFALKSLKESSDSGKDTTSTTSP